MDSVDSKSALVLVMWWLGTEPTLTHLGRVTRIYVSRLNRHWFRWWLVAWSAPSHNLNEWYFIVNRAVVNICQWNLNRNASMFNVENVFENIVCKRPASLSWPQCVNPVLWCMYIYVNRPQCVATRQGRCHVTTYMMTSQKIREALHLMTFKSIHVLYKMSTSWMSCQEKTTRSGRLYGGSA